MTKPTKPVSWFCKQRQSAASWQPGLRCLSPAPLPRLRSWPTSDLEVVGTTNASGGTTIVQPGLAGLALVPQAPACQAGVTGDGTVDGSDFIAFIDSFGIGDPDVDPAGDVAGAGADGNTPDGAIDSSELIALTNAFAIGC